jgi:hypothetical protein
VYKKLIDTWLATTSPSMPLLEDPRLVAIGLGLLTHLVFKTTEPRQPLVWLLLLIGGPAALTISVNYAFSSVTTAVLSVFSIYFASPYLVRTVPLVAIPSAGSVPWSHLAQAVEFSDGPRCVDRKEALVHH